MPSTYRPTIVSFLRPTNILGLLAKLKDKTQEEARKIEQEIFGQLANNIKLRSKRDLIERFIKENLPLVLDSDSIPAAFDQFWQEAQKEAFEAIVKEENLVPDATEQLIENYLFSDRRPLSNEVIGLIAGAKPGIRDRRTIGDRILTRIVQFVEVFLKETG